MDEWMDWHVISGCIWWSRGPQDWDQKACNSCPWPNIFGSQGLLMMVSNVVLELNSGTNAAFL